MRVLVMVFISAFIGGVLGILIGNMLYVEPYQPQTVIGDKWYRDAVKTEREYIRDYYKSKNLEEVIAPNRDSLFTAYINKWDGVVPSIK